MNQNIKIKNELHCTTIDIEGTIGLSEEWQFENPESRIATYERFRESVSQIADIQNSHIVVNIRSTGGDVNDAILIYEALLVFASLLLQESKKQALFSLTCKATRCFSLTNQEMSFMSSKENHKQEK